MCGIWGYICSTENNHNKIVGLFDNFMKIKPR